MNQRISRRKVIQGSAAVAAAGFFGFSARSYGNIIGSNDDIRVGVIGFKSRGNSHIDAWRKIKGVRLVALCDADKDVLAKGLSRVEDKPKSKEKEKEKDKPAKPVAKSDRKEMQGKPEDAAEGKENKTATKVEGYTDLRKLLDNKDIDAVSTATPNHWHSLIVVWACQAGKDVYVEKPVSHNVWEGAQAIAAARKYKRIVQTGTQARANGALGEAYKWVQGGGLGKVKVARGLCYKRRASIGDTEGPQKVPESVDYDLWSGPAQLTPPHRKQFHYDWHWQWPYGNGDLGNQGIHQMDTARWALGKDELAPRVMSIGGRFGYEDDGETPNTQFVIQDYGDSMLIFEVRGLPKEKGSGLMDKYKGLTVGTVIECEDGYLVDSGYSSHPTAYDWNGKQIRKFEYKFEKSDINDSSGNAHFANWIECVRSRDQKALNADIKEGHLSSALCHTGNISYLLGKPTPAEEITNVLKDQPEALKTFEHFKEHLELNEVSLKDTKPVLGAFLTMDPKTETFTGKNADAANKLLTRDYRKGYEVPKEV